MVYQMGWGPVLDGLVAKARAGVEVRVILDLAQKPVNQKYRDKLEEAGATVIWSDPRFNFMHARVIIIDRAEALLDRQLQPVVHAEGRNYAVRDRDAGRRPLAQAIFDADWQRHGTPDLSCASPRRARQRGAPPRAHQLRADLARHREHASSGDKDVRNAVAARKAAGVDVRVILADPGWIDSNASAGTFLQQHGIRPKFYPHTHVKSIVVDGKAAYVGSVNLSWNSIDKNREVGVVVTEQANIDSIMATFEHDWTAGTDFPALLIPDPAPATDAAEAAE